MNFQTNLFMLHLLLSAADQPNGFSSSLSDGLHFDFENGQELFIHLLLPLYLCGEKSGTPAASLFPPALLTSVASALVPDGSVKDIQALRGHSGAEMVLDGRYRTTCPL